jgi:hypothetical protein
MLRVWGIKMSTLDDLSYGYMSKEDWDEFFLTKPSLSDRECAVRLGAIIELTLKVLLEFRLAELPEEERAALFIGRGKFANFANKIKEARNLRLIDVDTRRDLEILKTIRNAFAHYARRLTLEADELRELCLKFRGLKKVEGVNEQNLGDLTSRQIFDLVTDDLLKNTLNNAWHEEIAKRDAARTYSTKPGKSDQKSNVANASLRLVVSNDEASVSRMSKSLEASASATQEEQAAKWQKEDTERKRARNAQIRKAAEAEQIEKLKEEERQKAVRESERLRKAAEDKKSSKEVLKKIIEAGTANREMSYVHSLLGQLSEEDFNLVDKSLQDELAVRQEKEQQKLIKDKQEAQYHADRLRKAAQVESAAEWERQRSANSHNVNPADVSEAQQRMMLRAQGVVQVEKAGKVDDLRPFWEKSYEELSLNDYDHMKELMNCMDQSGTLPGMSDEDHQIAHRYIVNFERKHGHVVPEQGREFWSERHPIIKGRTRDATGRETVVEPNDAGFVVWSPTRR